MTELLARQGQGRGHEVMNQIMNNLFTTVLDPLIASGGDLLVFVGDAALVYFPKKDHNEDVLQATRAALRMERAISPFASFETAYGPCSLTMSAGVERGIAYAGIVGDSRRMELLISGPGIYGATYAEQQAQPGQVMLGEQARAIAAPHFTLDGRLVIDDLGQALGDYEISLPTRRAGGLAVFGLTVSEALQTLETTLQRVRTPGPIFARRYAGSAGQYRSPAPFATRTSSGRRPIYQPLGSRRVSNKPGTRTCYGRLSALFYTGPGNC